MGINKMTTGSTLCGLLFATVLSTLIQSSNAHVAKRLEQHPCLLQVAGKHHRRRLSPSVDSKPWWKNHCEILSPGKAREMCYQIAGNRMSQSQALKLTKVLKEHLMQKGIIEQILVIAGRRDPEKLAKIRRCLQKCRAANGDRRRLAEAAVSAGSPTALYWTLAGIYLTYAGKDLFSQHMTNAQVVTLLGMKTCNDGYCPLDDVKKAATVAHDAEDLRIITQPFNTLAVGLTKAVGDLTEAVGDVTGSVKNSTGDNKKDKKPSADKKPSEGQEEANPDTRVAVAKGQQDQQPAAAEEKPDEDKVESVIAH